jgi:hypothetical protein
MRMVKLAIVALVMVLAGCASGVKHKDMASSIPTLQGDQGRIYFFRPSGLIGAGIQPGVMLDGVRVGESQPGGFFYVDAKPGNHEVVTTSEVEKKLTFTLAKGETKYVKSSVGMGVLVYRIYPELVSADEGQKELSELSYTGTPAPAK